MEYKLERLGVWEETYRVEHWYGGTNLHRVQQTLPLPPRPFVLRPPSHDPSHKGAVAWALLHDRTPNKQQLLTHHPIVARPDAI